jgi:branched-subunit amino acid aminotransferase/4-amino-4-deoxychorismate lyase
LYRGAEFLKIKPPFSPKEIQEIAAQLIEKNSLPEAVLRVMLTRGAGERGYTPGAADTPMLALTLHPLPPACHDESLQWSMVTSKFHIPAHDPISGFKTTNKLLNVLARVDAQERGADEALLLNTNGEVAESAGGNVFWVYQNRICTVPSGRGVLPGITRAVVLEICQSLGLETNKRVVKPAQLQKSEGIFVTQSIYGIVPIAAFEGQPIAPSPLVDQIMNAYHNVLVAESSDRVRA